MGKDKGDIVERKDDKGDDTMNKGKKPEGMNPGNGLLACKNVRENLAAFLAGEISSEHSNLIRAHIRECKTCKKALTVQTNLNRVIRESIRPNVPPSYWDSVWPQVRASMVERRSRRPRFTLRWAFAGIGAFAAAAATFVIFMISRPAIAPTLAAHDASHYADMPSEPAVVMEQDDGERVTYEFASLTMGNPTPTQRIISWNRMEGL